VPRTGGLFRVTIFPSASTPTLPSDEGEGAGEEGKVLWDRKRDGGFPGMYLPFFFSSSLSEVGVLIPERGRPGYECASVLTRF
jgi:hypothetical protein